MSRNVLSLFLVTLVMAFTQTGCGTQVPEKERTSDVPRDTSATDTLPVTDDGSDGFSVDSTVFLGEGPIKLVRAHVHLAKGLDFDLRIPEGYELKVAAEGFERLRFMACSTGDRLYVTDMHDLTDNRKGKVYRLGDWNEDSARFLTRELCLDGLRNPNQILLHTDSLQHWMYVATTDRLLRYPISDDDAFSAGTPEVIDTFPAYGLSYKYGGWHLTRSLLMRNGKLYVSVGSSCNACIEKEEVRATILEMDPDGHNKRIYATGLRNAVGMRSVGDRIFVTEMGSDQFGTDAPEDKLIGVVEGGFYGWPYFYQRGDSIVLDTAFAKPNMRLRPPLRAYSALGAHTAPLGFEFFDQFADDRLRNSFVVALHGSSMVPMAKGYAIVRVRKGEPTVPVVTGFLQHGERFGRPCDILLRGEEGLLKEPESFWFTDDLHGVLYLLRKKR
jgi:glucose/arabinose dehydrogenase